MDIELLDMKDASTVGNYAAVFLDRALGRAVKLYWAQGPNPYGVGNLIRDGQRRASFNAELDAYSITMRESALRPHIPEFFGTATVKTVIDSRRPGSNCAPFFLLDCCLVLELVAGTAHKLGAVLAGRPHLGAICGKFERAGVYYVEDAGVFSPDDPAGAKFIDFATHNPRFYGA